MTEANTRTTGRTCGGTDTRYRLRTGTGSEDSNQAAAVLTDRID